MTNPSTGRSIGDRGIDVLDDMHSSEGSPRDLTSFQIQALRALFADRDFGLWHFNHEVMGFTDMRWDLHGPICQFIGHWGESHLQDGTIIDGPPGLREDEVLDSYRRLMVRIPRECFKTSTCTRGGGLWTVLTKDINYTFGIFNEKQENVISWMNAMCDVVENSILLQVLYQDYIPKGIGYWDKEKGVSRARNQKWGGTGILFNRDTHGVSELTFEPQGIGGAHAGKHYTHMIWDDIIGLAASESPAVMQTAIDWVDHSRPLERPAEGGNVLINHTRWLYGDVYTHIERKWPEEFKILSRSLLENPDTGQPDDINGHSIFPEKISTKKALKMKSSDPYVFACQYMNIPRAGRSQSFQEHWLGSFHIYDLAENQPAIWIDFTGRDDPSLEPGFNDQAFELETQEAEAPQIIPLDQCHKAIILDPAPGKQSEMRQDPKARNGLVVVALDPWGRKFCLEAVPVTDTPIGVMDYIIHLYRKWKVSTVAIEAVNFSSVYGPLYQRIIELDPQYRDVRIDWAMTETGGRDKHKRMKDNLIPPMQRSLWYYNGFNPEQLELGPCAHLVKETFEYPYSETVDLLDALSYTDEVTFRPMTPDEEESRAHRRRLNNSSGGPTGYGDWTNMSSTYQRSKW